MEASDEILLRSDSDAWAASNGLTRKAFILAGCAAGISTALAGLPSALARHGLLDAARAVEPDLTLDTFNGFAALIMPGNDEYSMAQGVTTRRAGAIGTGAVPVIIETLDRFMPLPFAGGSTGQTVPASGAVTAFLNRYALEVNPAPTRGVFVSAFARLSHEEKAEVFELFESDPTFEGSEFRLVAGILPAFVPLSAYSEAPVLSDGELTGEPVGWRLCRFDGPSEGWPELRGYYRGHRQAKRRRPGNRR